ncbi:MAG: acyl-CoA carboxylase subunit beta [Proteobacteria bacterium]|nr:acyl-CoA carboxylase subunit beta [Pseudomonadota bacterium]
MSMHERIEELQMRRAKASAMGGERRIARQHDRGKMTARERIDVLLDDGSFLELGLHGSEYTEKHVPADGVVTGVGKVDGRSVCVAAYDFTVLGGSIGEIGRVKVARLREMALRNRIPMVWLVDSGGARIDPRPENLAKIPRFADSGYMFREQVIMSGVVPQVAAMVGPGFAGTAYIPGLADFVPMTKGTSSMGLAGPALVKAAVGEDIDEQALGGSKVHNRESGCADMEVKTDADCLEAVRAYLSYFPSSCRDKPPRREGAPGRGLIDDAILDLIPEGTRAAYDMRKLIPLITDGGEWFEMKGKFGTSITTGFARIAGHPIGIVGNNPKYLGGVINSKAADKAARFVNLCDAFNIPLLFLVDVPGFVVGSDAEQSGIIDHGSRMLFAVARATVPKFTVIVRKAYGAGYYAMCGRAFEPDLMVAWPTAEISVMGAEGMLGIAGGKMLANLPNAEEMKAQMIAMIEPYIDPYQVARLGLVDEIIDPRETRDVLITGLELTANKVIERPWRRHDVPP